MDSNKLAQIVLILLFAGGLCRAGQCAEAGGARKSTCPSRTEPKKIEPVDQVLNELSSKTQKIRSYQGQLEYKFIQPLLESEALRRGRLYYAKFDGKSMLRVNFETLKQDDEKEQRYLEHYIFDGVWLTQINYQIKAVKKYQLTEPNKPADALDVASRNLPLLGFTKIENLKRQFEIKLVGQEKKQDFVQLHLKVKPNSVYKDDYVWLDFWIDKKTGLPTKVRALSTEEDIYELKFLKPRIDKKIDKKVFEFKIPKDFGEPEIVPLKKKAG